MTPEALVKLHLQALTAGVPVPREQRLDVKGAVSAVTPARAAGLLPGHVPADLWRHRGAAGPAFRYRPL